MNEFRKDLKTFRWYTDLAQNLPNLIESKISDDKLKEWSKEWPQIYEFKGVWGKMNRQ